MSSPENGAAFQRNLSVLEAVIGDDHILFHSENGKYCRLNDTGNDVWNMLAATKTLAELTQALSRKYAVDPMLCQTETVMFLDKLKASDFISCAEAPLAKAAI